MPQGSRLDVRFYRTEAGNEPVREWLRALPKSERRGIGEDVRTLQLGWPLGMPLVRKLEPGLWEVRIHLPGRIARVIVTVEDEVVILLHAFIKRSKAIPAKELDTARRRRQRLTERE